MRLRMLAPFLIIRQHIRARRSITGTRAAPTDSWRHVTVWRPWLGYFRRMPI